METKKIILYIILAIGGVALLIAIGRVANAFFNNPLTRAAEDVLGSIANTLTTLTNGCSKQVDCAPITNIDTCNTTTGCAYSSEEQKCANTIPKDEGGFFTPSCGLGMGLLTLGIGAVLLGGLKLGSRLLGRNQPSEAVKNLSQISGETTDKVAKKVFNEMEAKRVLVEQEFEKKEGRKMTNNEKELAMKTVGNNDITQKTYNSIEKLPTSDSTKKVTLANEADARLIRNQDEAVKKFKARGGDDASAKKVTNAADEVTPRPKKPLPPIPR